MPTKHGGYDKDGNLHWFDNGLPQGYTKEPQKEVKKTTKKPVKPAKED